VVLHGQEVLVSSLTNREPHDPEPCALEPHGP